MVNDSVVARGEVVVVDGNYGIRVTEVTSRKERIQSIFLRREWRLYGTRSLAVAALTPAIQRLRRRCQSRDRKGAGSVKPTLASSPRGALGFPPRRDFEQMVGGPASRVQR